MSDNGFVGAEIDNIYVYSCYIAPSINIQTFEDIVLKLTIDARGRQNVLIAGDFNSWAQEWGCRRTTPRGRALLEAFACLDVVLLNTGNEPTFSRNGFGSIIDLTFISSGLYRFADWKNSTCYTQSDHSALICSINYRRERAKRIHNYGVSHGWKTSTLDSDLFTSMLPSTVYQGSADSMAEHLMADIRTACDASMVRRTPSTYRQPVYWWNDNIADLRRECLRCRRNSQRARGREHF